MDYCSEFIAVDLAGEEQGESVPVLPALVWLEQRREPDLERQQVESLWRIRRIGKESHERFNLGWAALHLEGRVLNFSLPTAC